MSIDSRPTVISESDSDRSAQESADNAPLAADSQPGNGAGSSIITAQLSAESGALATLKATAERATAYAEAALSPNTRRAYAAAQEHFAGWCRASGLEALPAEPQTLALYLTACAPRVTVATLRLRVAAIADAHRSRGLPRPSESDAVRLIMRGIAREHGRPPRRKAALTEDLLREALATLDGSLRGTRDRAMLLLGFSGAFRRSELAGLDVADVAFRRSGAVITLRLSKTDQTRAGREVPIPQVSVASICPVRALRAWLEVSRIADGPLFRTITAGAVTARRIDDRALLGLVRRTTGAAGIAGDFGAHSLRAGFVTSAARAKVTTTDIKRVTGHRSTIVLEGYVRRANVLEDPVLTRILR